MDFWCRRQRLQLMGFVVLLLLLTLVCIDSLPWALKPVTVAGTANARSALEPVPASASPLAVKPHAVRFAYGGYSHATEEWRRVQSTIDCWTSSGAWVSEDDTAWSHSVDAAHIWGHHGCPENWDNPSLNLTWKPTRRCEHPLPTKPRLDDLCRALNGRGVLLVGDSLDQQFHDVITGFAMKSNPKCPGNWCQGHDICVGSPHWPPARALPGTRERVVHDICVISRVSI